MGIQEMKPCLCQLLCELQPRLTQGLPPVCQEIMSDTTLAHQTCGLLREKNSHSVSLHQDLRLSCQLGSVTKFIMPAKISALQRRNHLWFTKRHRLPPVQHRKHKCQIDSCLKLLVFQGQLLSWRNHQHHRACRRAMATHSAQVGMIPCRQEKCLFLDR